MLHHFPPILFFLVALATLGRASLPHLVRHDSTFTPNIVLHITFQSTTQSCLSPKEIVLVNGSSPGPEVRIRAGRTYWIRVYNDMTEKNLTMVTQSTWLAHLYNSTSHISITILLYPH